MARSTMHSGPMTKCIKRKSRTNTGALLCERKTIPFAQRYNVFLIFVQKFKIATKMVENDFFFFFEK